MSYSTSILTVFILDFSTLSVTNLQILIANRYDKPLRHFYMGVPSGSSYAPSHPVFHPRFPSFYITHFPSFQCSPMLGYTTIGRSILPLMLCNKDYMQKGHFIKKYQVDLNKAFFFTSSLVQYCKIKVYLEYKPSQIMARYSSRPQQQSGIKNRIKNNTKQS